MARLRQEQPQEKINVVTVVAGLDFRQTINDRAMELLRAGLVVQDTG
jgi:hypothetical protein